MQFRSTEGECFAPYASWHWDVRLSLESYVGLKMVFYKKALGVHCCSLAPQKESASHHFKENCIEKCISGGNECIFASNLHCWWHLRWTSNFHIFLILHGRAVADFDGSCAAHVQADGRSEDMA